MLRKPPSPPSTPPSVMLLHAVSDLLRDTGDEAIDDLALIAAAMGVPLVDVPPLVARGVERDYLEDNDGIRLTPKGWAWYERHRDER